jgi:hypothetical protein
MNPPRKNLPLTCKTYLHISEIILESVIQALCDARFVPSLVLPYTNTTIQTHQEEGGNGSNDDALPPILVIGRVLWAEKERASEVS